MQTKNVVKLGLVALLAITLVACQTPEAEEEVTSGTGNSNAGSTSANTGGSTVANTNGNATSSGAGTNGGLSVSEIRERDDALAMTVFYFEFDRSDLNADVREALVHHANRLKENPTMSYRVEGHADERGTREYNLALGERRAQAIERYLEVQGVSSSQLETISYGEESPVASGSTEASYSRNRRVELH